MKERNCLGVHCVSNGIDGGFRMRLKRIPARSASCLLWLFKVIWVGVFFVHFNDALAEGKGTGPRLFDEIQVLDMETLRLPPHYRGMPFSGVVSTLNLMAEKRGGTAGYKGDGRKKYGAAGGPGVTESSLLFDGIRVSDNLAFVIPGLQIRYEEGNGLALIELGDEDFYLPFWSDEGWFVMSSSTSRPIGSYTASNAFGVRAKVKKYIHFEEWLKFKNCSGKGNDVRAKAVSLEVDGVPKEVIEDGRLRLLVIGPLAKPYYDLKEGDGEEPTFDNPVFIRNRIDNVYMDIKELWIFDYETGAIYKKIDRCAFLALLN